ncbi:MAG TPA: glycosyltransferase [Phenylobacterium sp.]|uniref:glycosyltransferase family 2 protein n=1 Tax=Phenylobacterium sp. TaxID=1871053 RepID=UPI002F92D949
MIVPHYNDLNSLDLCLEALSAQTVAGDDVEIVVADNGSPQGKAAVQSVIAGRARLVVVEMRGAGPARNGGVAASRGATLAFTDCDCRPDAAWLAEGLCALKAADFVGGRMDVLIDDPQRPTAEEAFELEFAFDNEAYVKQDGFTVTANLFCSRAMFDAVGGFKVGVPEDKEWCLRARSMGFRIGYAPRAIVGHPARRNWSELSSKWRRLSSEAFNLALQRPAGRLRWLLKTCALPISAVAHTPRVLGSSQLKTLDAKAGALVILYRLRIWRFMRGLQLVFAEGRG